MSDFSDSDDELDRHLKGVKGETIKPIPLIEEASFSMKMRVDRSEEISPVLFTQPELITNTKIVPIEEKKLSGNIISCENVRLYDCDNSVVIGYKNKDFANIKNSLIVNNIHQRHINIIARDGDVNYMFNVHNLLDIIYAYPMNGNIIIELPDDVPNNFQVKIKDVSLIYGGGSNYDVIIMGHLEHYKSGILTISKNGKYRINTNGGAITYRYYGEEKNIWLIENEFKGNVKSAGIKFVQMNKFFS